MPRLAHIFFIQIKHQCKRCGFAAIRERALLAPSKVLAIQFVWPTAERGADKERETITKLLRKTRQGFHKSFRMEVDLSILDYALTGFICYYGAHFVYFGCNAQQVWTLFDDSVMSILGSWSRVEEICIKGCWRPVLCLYTAVDFVP